MKTLIVAAIRCSLGFLLPTIVCAISAQCGLDPLSGNGTLQKMIVERGNATMDIDLNRLNGINSTREKVETLRFAVAANSFFPILVFNNALRGAELGSMGLIPQNSAALPAALIASLNQLVIEKIDWSGALDIVVRDRKSGFCAVAKIVNSTERE